MGTTSQADYLKEWTRLATMVAANEADLAHLESHRRQLVSEVEGLQEALARQATHKAEFQQATRDLEGHLRRGKDVSTRMRDGIRMTYGRRAEKLAAFGLQPYRARTQDTETKPQPSEASPTPAPAADPVTDPSL